MPIGHLTVICGPMYGGKTTELLKRVLWSRNGLGRHVLVVKPAFDNRYSVTKIVSHDGLSVDAISIKTWRNHVDGGRPELVCFDEVQFFTDPHFDCDIVDVIRGLLGEGVDVVANGLDMTADGDPFPITATLMALADEVVKVKSNCSICGTAATKTLKIAGSGAQIELGSVGMYEPRCNTHWE